MLVPALCVSFTGIATDDASEELLVLIKYTVCFPKVQPLSSQEGSSFSPAQQMSQQTQASQTAADHMDVQGRLCS